MRTSTNTSTAEAVVLFPSRTFDSGDSGMRETLLLKTPGSPLAKQSSHDGLEEIVRATFFGGGTEARVSTEAVYRYMLISSIADITSSELVIESTGAGKKCERDLNSYVGQWVALHSGSVVAHGGELADVVQVARKKGFSVPHVVFVEPVEEDVVKIGL